MFNPSKFHTRTESPLYELKTALPDKVVDGELHTMFGCVARGLYHSGTGISVLILTNGDIAMLGRSGSDWVVASLIDESMSLVEVKAALDRDVNTESVFASDAFYSADAQEVIADLRSMAGG